MQSYFSIYTYPSIYINYKNLNSSSHSFGSQRINATLMNAPIPKCALMKGRGRGNTAEN